MRRARVSILCALLAAVSASSRAGTVSECQTLTRHGQNAEARACYEALTKSGDAYLRAEGFWGLERYQQANN